MLYTKPNNRHKRVSHTIMLSSDYPEFEPSTFKADQSYPVTESAKNLFFNSRKNTLFNIQKTPDHLYLQPEHRPELTFSHNLNTKLKYPNKSQQKFDIKSVMWFFTTFVSVIKHLLLKKETRSIFIFLIFNLAYMFVQLVYGYLNNSLGLVSDAIHMFFDCIALAVGLGAAEMSKWSENSFFPNGYGRIQVLSGLINGVFLLLISVSIFCEAITRLIHPPEMHTNKLLLVSFGGLVVNMIGIFSFHDHHHNHSHEGGSCGGHDHNMEGVFLHVLADTLGSVGVIISTILINWFGWTGFDPLASIMIAVLIFASVIPLVKNSFLEILYKLPNSRMIGVEKALDSIQSSIIGINNFPSAQFWSQNGSTDMFGILEVNISLAALKQQFISNQHSTANHNSNFNVTFDNNSIVRETIIQVQKESRKQLEYHIGSFKDLSVQVTFE
ncbi:hypothetical protein BB561_000685 [Smittium simulii]|uniref:Cation efflux protein transmembrane domain-containing protein n=1 Tax=Smittium simulii TaxID=133385 RepID=A0A2T9YY44_9FUNG|nr:hypothetical protein BB561_000685 [Smittium simulii]